MGKKEEKNLFKCKFDPPSLKYIKKSFYVEFLLGRVNCNFKKKVINLRVKNLVGLDSWN